VDSKLVRALQHPFNPEERRALHNYLLVLATCNTVVPTRVSISTTTGQVEMEAAGPEEEAGLMEYQGESPDEQALVAAAASYGYTLLERTSTHVVIDVLGEIQRYVSGFGRVMFESSKRILHVKMCRSVGRPAGFVNDLTMFTC
jgi:phospholipid-transporting ATPase